jgi:DNA-binding response OmpR family regulator
VTAPDDTLVRLDSLRLLVVEDEALVAMLVEEELARAGATVLGIACSVEGALYRIEAAQETGGLDACLLDINLGGASSLPVADRLARDGVPFVFMTGYHDGFVQGRHAGTPTLHKPFDPQKMIGLLRHAVPERRLTAPCLDGVRPGGTT